MASWHLQHYTLITVFKILGPSHRGPHNSNANDMPGTHHRMSSRPKNYWTWKNNDHIHLQTPFHPSADKKFHTNKRLSTHDEGVTTTKYIYITTIHTCQLAESAKQCQLLSPFPTDISSHEDKTFRANTSISLSPPPLPLSLSIFLPPT
jgi:hypothetical protein